MKEKKKLEGELEAMGQSEDFELIDENKKAYDEVVEELKKLESEQFAPRPEWTVEEKEAYRLKKEELLEEKAALADLLEKQLQMNTAMPEQRRQLEMRVYSLEIRLSVLEKEKEKEHAACGKCQRENEEAVESTLGTLRQCEELLKKYQTAVVNVGLSRWVDVQKSVREAPQYVFTTDDEEAEWLLNSSENSMMDACMREVPEMDVRDVPEGDPTWPERNAVFDETYSPSYKTGCIMAEWYFGDDNRDSIVSSPCLEDDFSMYPPTRIFVCEFDTLKIAARAAYEKMKVVFRRER